MVQKNEERKFRLQYVAAFELNTHACGSVETVCSAPFELAWVGDEKARVVVLVVQLQTQVWKMSCHVVRHGEGVHWSLNYLLKRRERSAA